ncbi:hypothetical protein Anapl_07212 [Anas platyrhynchos]|uniref:Uncharacterized protein n=1 Tax=Anas platyrhynchos TaxID=8839 RepID=R0LMQ5_ANAPL|nr:hypothetical protein Anapl_07212 [Anas platyrhynchos]
MALLSEKSSTTHQQTLQAAFLRAAATASRKVETVSGSVSLNTARAKQGSSRLVHCQLFTPDSSCTCAFRTDLSPQPLQATSAMHQKWATQRKMLLLFLHPIFLQIKTEHKHVCKLTAIGLMASPEFCSCQLQQSNKVIVCSKQIVIWSPGELGMGCQSIHALSLLLHNPFEKDCVSFLRSVETPSGKTKAAQESNDTRVAEVFGAEACFACFIPGESFLSAEQFSADKLQAASGSFTSPEE